MNIRLLSKCSLTPVRTKTPPESRRLRLLRDPVVLGPVAKDNLIIADKGLSDVLSTVRRYAGP